VLHFCEVVDAWPIGIGAPCFGCTEQSVGFRLPAFQTVQIQRPTPPDTYPPISANQGSVSPIATGVAGLVGGALLGAGFMASKKIGRTGSPPHEGHHGADEADTKE
jgi:hydrogenase small subunit